MDNKIEPLGKYPSIQPADNSTPIVKDGVTIYPEKQLKDNIIYQGKPQLPPNVKKAMADNGTVTFESMLANSTPKETDTNTIVQGIHMTEQDKVLAYLNSRTFHIPVKGKSEADIAAIKTAEEKRTMRAAKLSKQQK